MATCNGSLSTFSSYGRRPANSCHRGYSYTNRSRVFLRHGYQERRQLVGFVHDHMASKGRRHRGGEYGCVPRLPKGATVPGVDRSRVKGRRPCLTTRRSRGARVTRDLHTSRLLAMSRNRYYRWPKRQLQLRRVHSSIQWDVGVLSRDNAMVRVARSRGYSRCV